MITIIGCGTKKGDLTADGEKAVKTAAKVLAKSAKTHVAEILRDLHVDFTACDDLYESAENFDRLNEAIIARLQQYGDVAFCVYGNGYDDATVRQMEAENIPFRLVCGVSGSAVVLEKRYADGCKTYGALAFLQEKYVSAENLVICDVYDKLIASEVKLKLLSAFDPDTEVVFGGAKAKVIPLAEADRQKYDHRTCLFISPKKFLDKTVFDYTDVRRLLALLRDKNGCPWDRVQTHETLRKNVIEEACELANAIDKGDIDNVIEELGDVLMQVAFHIGIAEDTGEFTAADVYSALCNKLISRHTHVFGDKAAKNAEEALANWDEVKLKEHKIASLTQNLEDIPLSLTALMYAEKAQKRAAKGGYDFRNAEETKSKLLEEIGEFLQAREEQKEEEGGDVLFAAVNLLRLSGVDAETALEKVNHKFVSRVTACEEILQGENKKLTDLSQEEFDALWNKVKKREDR